MSDGSIDLRGEARAKAYALPLDQIDVAQPALFQADAHWPYFERLRREDPVHYCAESEHGPYWSITKYNDIVDVDSNHRVFSSDATVGGIGIRGVPNAEGPSMFISMDPPRHDEQRKVVSPVVSPANLRTMEPLIRERTQRVLDSLPIGEPFDWVDRVSIELTTQMLATLFDFPFDERRNLTKWSDIFTGAGRLHGIETEEDRVMEMLRFRAAFDGLWKQRIAAPPAGDLISMLAHSDATRAMGEREYHGNCVLLIVGGNDTTRNTMSGSVYALNQFPGEFAKLRANPELLPSMVSETIRWQTPLAHMRRTALEAIEFRGRTIRKGDKVVMWYVSGNRDEEVIENPNAYIIDRERPRQHLSFGFGIHRCVGNRLAELQLLILWQEILARFDDIQVLEEPRRTLSVFVKGYESMQVVIPARKAAG
jgi:cytochrome P450